METFNFKIRLSEIDLKSLENNINEKIKLRQEQGVYDHYDLSKVMHYKLLSTVNVKERLNEYLKAVRRSWAIDINDFEICVKHKGFKGLLELFLKKIIWKMLKFYTYRLFIQQREFNFQIANTIILIKEEYEKKISELENDLELLK